MDIKLKLIIGTLKLFSWLPLGLTKRIGVGIGYLLWLFPNRSKATTQTNIALCYRDLDIQQQRVLAKRSLIETATLMCEMGAIWMWPPEKCLALIKQIRGLENMQAAQQKQQGILILLPHLGNWELMAPYLAQHHKITALYQPPKLKALETIIVQARQRNHLTTVPTNAKGIAQLLRALKAGETVVILPDQEPNALSSGVFASFMGVPALTMTLVNKLLQKTQAQTLFAYVLRENTSVDVGYLKEDPAKKRYGYSVNFMPARSEVYATDPVLAARAMNADLELCVAAAPAQYQWEYKRFKKQPDTRIDVYRKKRTE